MIGCLFIYLPSSTATLPARLRVRVVSVVYIQKIEGIVYKHSTTSTLTASISYL